MHIIIMLFTVMFILILLGVPLVYSIGVASICVGVGQGFIDLTLLPSRMFKGLSSFILLAIPFFLLTAEILTQGGLVKRLINFCDKLIGHVRGGLAQVNIIASMIFAGIQASCTADSAAIGGILIPAMIKKGYDKDISVVVTATSSCCGPIIPPSILMILYAFLTETSVAKLFIGGAIPGIILGFSLMGITDFWVKKRGYKKDREKIAPLKEITKSAIETLPAILVPLIIIVGILGGICTPAEAGVLACTAALFIAGLVYRELSVSKIVTSLENAMYTTATIWCVIATSTVFSELLVRANFINKILTVISSTTFNPTGVLVLMVSFIFLLGMVIDTTPLLIMVADPLYRAAMTLGIDPVQLGVVLVMAALIGTVSPPVSLLLCLDCGIAKIPLQETFGIIWSYLLVMFGVVLLCVFFPPLVTWLPNLLLKN